MTYQLENLEGNFLLSPTSGGVDALTAGAAVGICSYINHSSVLHGWHHDWDSSLLLH